MKTLLKKTVLKSFYLLVALIVLTELSFTGCVEQDKSYTSSFKPNIIYILADDLGYGDLGCYGQEQIRTPNIDKLATEGIRFTDHYAGSTVCAPSRCSLISGKHIGKSRIRGNSEVSLLASDTTVAEILKNEGYVTAMFGKWGLGEYGTSGHPNDKGFTHFVGYLNQIRAHNAYPDWVWKNKDTLKLDNKVEIIPVGYAKGLGGVATEKNTHSQDVFTNEALKFIEANHDTSFFLYLPYTLPHANNESGYWKKIGIEVPELMGYDTIADWNDTKKAYAASISYLDRDVGKIVAKLKELGLEKNTIVIFTSDNGPHAEGGHNPAAFNSSGALRGMKRDLYEGGIRVPMIACWPGKIKPGTTSNHISAFWDFLPTACDIAQTDKPLFTNGISFLPELLGEEQEKHNHLYWEFYEGNGKQAVRFGKWKGVRLNMSANPDAPIELYNLSTDIGEQNNLAAEYPEIVEEISNIMEREHTYSEDFNFKYE